MELFHQSDRLQEADPDIIQGVIQSYADLGGTGTEPTSEDEGYAELCHNITNIIYDFYRLWKWLLCWLYDKVLFKWTKNARKTGKSNYKMKILLCLSLSDN